MKRTPEEAAKTRQKVVEAALKLFGQRGYSGTTLRLIAEEAGCSRGPIYWHFANKEELFEEILAYSQLPLEDLVNEFRDSDRPIDAARDFATRWLQLLVSDRYFRQSFEIFLNKTEFTEAVAGTLRKERELTASLIGTFGNWVRLHHEGTAARPGSEQVIALSMYSYLMGITHSWLFDPGLADLETQCPFFVGEFLRLMGVPTSAT